MTNIIKFTILLISWFNVSLAANIEINGQFLILKAGEHVPQKWHTYTDALAQDSVAFQLVPAPNTELPNSYHIINKSTAGSAALCLSKPVKKITDKDSFTFTCQIRSNSILGVVYVNIYSIDKKSRKKSWGHALIRQGGVHSWTNETISFSLPENASGFGINLVQNGPGEVWFRDLHLTRQDHAAEVIDTQGENTFLLVGPRELPDETIEGIFTHSDHDLVLYGQAPISTLSNETSISMSMARNEITGFPVSIFLPIEDELELIFASPFLTVQPIHYWPQRRSDRTNSDAILRAELIGSLPNEVRVSGAQRQSFWISLDARLAGQIGVIREQIIFLGGSSQYKLNLAIHIQDFELSDRYGRWGLWVDSNRWKTWTDSEIFDEMRVISETGYTSLILSDPGAIKNSTSTAGDERILDWQFIGRILSLYETAGYSGPPILSLQHMLKRINELSKQSKFTTDQNTVKVLNQVFLRIKQQWPTTVLFFDDELNRKSEEQKKAASVIYMLAREAGLETFLTLTRTKPGISTLLSSDYTLYNGHAAAGSDFLRSINLLSDNPIHWYASGTYQAQEGFIYPNRILTGFMNWKLKSNFHGTWTFQRPDGNPFNDFDGKRKDWCLAYPKEDEHSSIYTVQWEAIRLGINDYKYLSACQQFIEEALQDDSKLNDPIAKQAKQHIMQFESNTPWLYDEEIDGAILSSWRNELLEYCVQLTQSSE